MITTNIICNGCSVFLMRQKYNTTKIDVKRVMANETGFILKESEIELHFCNECYSRVYDKSGRISFESFSGVDNLIKEHKEMKGEYEKVKRDYLEYRTRVSNILKNNLD